MLTLVRVPYLSRYNLQDVREEPIVSSLAGYLNAVGEPYKVLDFHLDRYVTIDTIVETRADKYVVAVRGTGLHWKYAEKVTLHLLAKTKSKIFIYGQTGKLQHWSNPDPSRVFVVPHDERILAQKLGISEDGPSFVNGLRHSHYAKELMPQLGPRGAIFKATIETTRGCHYGCKFCFINHGLNYSTRFERRPVSDVLDDMHSYIRQGISRFWFYDSEFIGADKNHYPQVRELLSRIPKELPQAVEIMLYSRADTLEKFGEYELMRHAGVNSILMGVESLFDQDLKAMSKAQTSSIATNAIRNLRDNKIFCNLSFILFNKTATIESLRQNINALVSLYSEHAFVYLGQTLYFTYAFESDWRPSLHARPLSGTTNLLGSTRSTVSPNSGVVFDPMLEPYAEYCRILNYEQVRKLSELNLAKEADEQIDRRTVHNWAVLLNLFSLNLMGVGLDEFESGRLSVDTVEKYVAWMFRAFSRFYKDTLPARWSHTVTENREQAYPEGDWNGWEGEIPSILSGI